MRSPAPWPMRPTSPGSPQSTTPPTSGCATSGKPSLSPGGGSARCCSFGWTAPAATVGWPMLWHDQTKVGRHDQAIRIPEPLFERLAQRRETTLSRFTARHGHAPTSEQRAAMALFPGRYRNPDGATAVTYQWFHSRFKQWVDELDWPLGRPPGQAHAGHQPAAARRQPHPHPPLPRACLRPDGRALHPAVPLRSRGRPAARVGRRTRHRQPRHAALRPPRHAADPRAGPGASRGPVPAQHPSRGRILHLPARRGWRRLPVDLDCHNCDKFVLSGADLLYWRRKREQWSRSPSAHRTTPPPDRKSVV